MAQRARGKAASNEGLDRARLARVLAFMEARLHAKTDLAAIAGSAGLSPFHFARLFKKSMGHTPREYLTRMRLNRATVLLWATRIPIGEVAARTGFSGQARFTTVFRRYLAITPKQYRIRGMLVSEDELAADDFRSLVATARSHVERVMERRGLTPARGWRVAEHTLAESNGTALVLAPTHRTSSQPDRLRCTVSVDGKSGKALVRCECDPPLARAAAMT